MALLSPHNPSTLPTEKSVPTADLKLLCSHYLALLTVEQSRDTKWRELNSCGARKAGSETVDMPIIRFCRLSTGNLVDLLGTSAIESEEVPLMLHNQISLGQNVTLNAVPSPAVGLKVITAWFNEAVVARAHDDGMTLASVPR